MKMNLPKVEEKMNLLRWVETNAGGMSRPFIKAEIINIDMNFNDICGNRSWGNNRFYLQIKFSIHERIRATNGYTHQLLAPNGIHIYCKDVEEAKEVAEIMYRRILDAFSEQVIVQFANVKPEPVPVPAKKTTLDYSKLTHEQFNAVMYKRFCRNTKHKTKNLLTLLEKRGIVGRVYYSRLRKQIGWMINQGGNSPQLIGSNYQQALEFIGSGSLDFMKG